MVRWLGQRDGFRCAPIALVNIMKWAGVKKFRGRRVNEELAKGYLCKICKTTREGTWPSKSESLLRKIPGIAVSKRLHPKLYMVKDHLKHGGIILLEYGPIDPVTGETTWHYAILLDSFANGRLYTILNPVTGNAKGIIRKQTLRKYLRHPDATIHLISKRS